MLTKGRVARSNFSAMSEDEPGDGEERQVLTNSRDVFEKTNAEVTVSMIAFKVEWRDPVSRKAYRGSLDVGKYEKVRVLTNVYVRIAAGVISCFVDRVVVGDYS